MLAVSFKHDECQKKQRQNVPVFLPPLSGYLHQASSLSFLSSSPRFIHRSHVHVQHLRTQSVAE